MIPQHDKTPNLKLVMNPEGKVHDWSDLPDDEVPHLETMAAGGNPEAAHAMVENLQACKGRGRVSFAQPKTDHHATSTLNTYPQSNLHLRNRPFQSSFKQVFNDRRGIFEKGHTGFEAKIRTAAVETVDDLKLSRFFGSAAIGFDRDDHDTSRTGAMLSRSKTMPNMIDSLPKSCPIPDEESKSSPRVPERCASRYAVRGAKTAAPDQSPDHEGGKMKSRGAARSSSSDVKTPPPPAASGLVNLPNKIKARGQFQRKEEENKHFISWRPLRDFF